MMQRPGHKGIGLWTHGVIMDGQVDTSIHRQPVSTTTIAHPHWRIGET
jgi:hypothetical protein